MRFLYSEFLRHNFLEDYDCGILHLEGRKIEFAISVVKNINSWEFLGITEFDVHFSDADGLDLYPSLIDDMSFHEMVATISQRVGRRIFPNTHSEEIVHVLDIDSSIYMFNNRVNFYYKSIVDFEVSVK